MSHNFPQAIPWFFVTEIALVGVFFHLLPDLRRRDVYFAVTVPCGFRETNEAQEVVRRFRRSVWIHSLLALGIVLGGLATRNASLLLGGVYWQALGAFLAFRKGRKQVQLRAVPPSPLRGAGLALRPTGSVGHRLLQLGPFGILGAAGLYLNAHWNALPERFPIHWGMDGKPNGWATRNFLGVYGSLVIGIGVCAGLALMAYETFHWSRQVRATGEAAEKEARFRQRQLAILLSTEYLIAMVFSWVSLLPLRRDPEMMSGSFTLLLLGILAYVFGVILLLVRTGQGRSRLSAGVKEVEIPPGACSPGDGIPDRCWKAVVFYVNRDDPAIVVEKRFGIGYTLNFGNPRSWIVLLALVGVPLALVFLTNRR